MDYEQASIIGKRRRADAAMLLSGRVRERVGEFCAVKAAKGQELDARDWEPVGEQSIKEISIRSGLGGDKEAFLLIVDRDGATYLGPNGAICRRPEVMIAEKAQAHMLRASDSLGLSPSARSRITVDDPGETDAAIQQRLNSPAPKKK
jgi:hypothetical protein